MNKNVLFFLALLFYNLPTMYLHGRQNDNIIENEIKLDSNFEAFLNKLQLKSFPIDFNEIVKQYYNPDSLSCTDTTFYFYNRVKPNLTLQGFEHSFFNFNEYLNNKNIELNNLANNMNYKIPIFYTKGEKIIIVFFFSFATCEKDRDTQFLSIEINAGIYDFKGNLINFNFEDCPFIECFSVKSMDMSIIVNSTYWDTASKINQFKIIYDTERDYEMIYGEGELKQELPIVHLFKKKIEIQILQNEIISNIINQNDEKFY